MRKRGLGRGIESLIGGEEKKAAPEGYRLIPIAEIKPNPYQPRSRIDDADIKELARSISQRGVLEPIIVRRQNGEYVLAAGERRFQAARLAGLTEIPAIVRNLTERELLEVALIENLHRRDLNPIDEAEGYDELHRQFDLTHEAIAQLTGKDRSTVTNSLRLLTLPDKIKTLLRDGRINEGHARALLTVEGEVKRMQLAERIVREELSVRAAERIARQSHPRTAIQPGPEKEPNLLILEDELSKIMRTKVVVNWKNRRGTITIHCHSLEDFNRIYDMIRRAQRG